MAGPQYATSNVLELGPTDSFFVAGIQDTAGNIAAATTKFVQRPSGLLLPEQTDVNGIPLRVSRVTTAITTAALDASDTYTQAWQNAQTLAVTYVGGSVTTAEAGTLYIDFSDDGTNVCATSSTALTVTPTTVGTIQAFGLPYPVEIPNQYFRFRYVNGAVAQSSLAIYQTPMSDWSPQNIGLTGNLAPHALVILTFGPYAYTEWGNSGNSFNLRMGGFARNRQRLTFIIYQDLGVNISGDVWPVDSEYLAEGILGESNSIGTLYASSSMQTASFYPSQDSFNIGVDTIQWSTEASAPTTSGSLTIVAIQEL